MDSITYNNNSHERNDQKITRGWDDNRDYKTGTDSKTFMDDTLPDGPHQRTIEYTAPFFCPNREEDYRVAREVFESKSAESSS